ncbi:MAG: NAD(P)H-dependent oxidoreductase [Aerococcus sp.]|nr:NAD(P)H-dependent oxidoreductase [Aerococcus sp.]
MTPMRSTKRDEARMQTVIFCGHPHLEASGSHQFLKAATPKSIPFEQIELPLTTETIEHHQSLIMTCDRFFIQFPLYWYQAPGSISGWLEAVLTDDFMESMGTHWQDKEMGIILSTGRPVSAFQSGGEENFTISDLLKPFEALATNLGMTYLPPFVLAQHHYATPEEQRCHLIQYQMALTLPKGAHFSERTRWLMASLKEHERTLPDVLKEQLEPFLMSWEDALDQWEALRMELPKNPWQ